MKTKEIPAAGFCVIRPDIIKEHLSVPVKGTNFGGKEAVMYRWLKEDEGFQIHLYGKWRDAESIDFDFLSNEKEILKRFFFNFTFMDATDEVKKWSAKYLKQFLILLGYKTNKKEIMVSMIMSLAGKYAWKLTAQSTNHFLIKK